MLKASLFTLICGLVSAKIPVFIVYPSLALLPALEVIYLAVHHNRALHHFGGTFLVLLLVGLSSFYAATCFLLGGHLKARRR